MKLNNKLAVIINSKRYKKYLIEKLKEKNVENINESLFFIEYNDIYENINEVNKLNVDFIVIENLELFKDFDNLQEKANTLILNPIDTMASYLINDLNKFPLWTLESKLAYSLLERYNIAYQVLDRNSKKVFSDLPNSKNIISELNIEIDKYKNIGIDSIVVDLPFYELPPQIKDVDLYEINTKYLKKAIKIMFL